MKRIHALLLSTAALLSLAACQDNAPASSGNATPATTGTNAKPAASGGLTGMIDKAMDEARVKMQTSNIDITRGASFKVNGHEISASGLNLPKAEITPKGELLVDGKLVPVNARQQVMLLQYRGQMIDVANAGIDIGKQGVDIAGKAVSSAIAGIFNGGNKQAESEIEAQGKQINAAALKLCDLLPPLMQTQQALAAELPAFKPYANMTQGDIDDCRKRDKGDGAAVFSD